MDINLRQISEEEFKQDPSPVLFSDKVSNRCFALFGGKSSGFKLAWHSDLIDPAFLEIKENIYCIGVDQNFAIVNFNSGEIIFKLVLAYNFLNIKPGNGLVFIISELEIIVVSSEHFSVIGEYGLPDLFNDIEIGKDRVSVYCFDGQEVEIDVRSIGRP